MTYTLLGCGSTRMAAIVDVSEAENGSGFEVLVEWVRFDEENTWEALAKIWDAAPQFVKAVAQDGIDAGYARAALE